MPEQQTLSPGFENFNVSNVSVEVEFSHEDSAKYFNFLKAFLLLIAISKLPIEGIQESVETLEQIKEFYGESTSEIAQSTPTPEIVSGDVVFTETRSPLSLSWD